jgi:hypothetical protein
VQGHHVPRQNVLLKAMISMTPRAVSLAPLKARIISYQIVVGCRISHRSKNWPLTSQMGSERGDVGLMSVVPESTERLGDL